MLHRDKAHSANCAADHGDLTGPVLGFAVDAPVVSTVDTYSASVQGGLHGRILIFST